MALWRLTGDARPAVRVLTGNLAEASGASGRMILADLAELDLAAPAVEAILPYLDAGSNTDRHLAGHAITRIGRRGLPASASARWSGRTSACGETPSAC